MGERVCIPLKEGRSFQNYPWQEEIIELVFEVIPQTPSSLKEALLEIPDIDKDQLQTSFDHIGDIAVIDLKDPLLPYKDKIGKALMRTNPSIKAVYRKSSAVQGQFRTRELEHIAGENRSSTIHTEYGIKIYVDLNRAYFSPRLSTEHNRVAMKIQNHGPVLDLFAGVASFGLHLTKKFDVWVDSIDINPHIPSMVQKSIQLNKLKGHINPICMDASSYLEQLETHPKPYANIIMNHPSGATEFLEDTISISQSGTRLFYYTFLPISNLKNKGKEQIKKYENQTTLDTLHKVRQYSPQEFQVCLELIRR